MKKQLFLLGAALFTIYSCTNEISEEGFVDKTKSISFGAYSVKTRAVDGDVTSDNMKGDNFGVAGYKSDNSIYLYKNTNGAVEQTWNSTSSTWEYKTPGDLKFWPDGEMDFYAYFPYSYNATFAESDASGDVMTIANVNCSHDVLFAKHTTSYTERVPLTFYHAFSKIKKVNVSIGDNTDKGYVKDAGVSVEIQKVEFISTSTSGTVKVDNGGVASYEVASTNVTLSKDLSSSLVTVNSTELTGTLIDNSTSGGYLFATTSESTATKNVKGTGKTMWDGTNTSWAEGTTLENLEQVCLKLTCKVWNGTDDNKYYYLGDNTNYGFMYIPLTGTSADPSNVTTFEAGKRYTYNIIFKDNVGFRDNGDPVLRPILFNVENVTGWDDVTVTITL
ncbi:MAG: fimbrillin family protein [Prevotella sp.]|nr:fimbrillin family protein [Prevotella sp.]